MKIRIINSDLTKIKADVLVVNLFEGEKKPGGATGAADKALGGLISKLIAKGEITGKKASSTIIHSFGKLNVDRVLVMGLGKKEDFDLYVSRVVAASAIRTAKKIKAKVVATIVHGAGIGGLDPAQACSALCEVSLINEYELKSYKSKDENDKITELLVVESDKAKAGKYGAAAKNAEIICSSINKARDLVFAPSNLLTPTDFAGIAKKVASANRLKIKVLGKKEIIKLKMGLLWGVAIGSDEEPKVVVLEHNGSYSKDKFALIGKGITFDSGGISLKPSRKMDEMKTDMAGAAAMLYAMEAISKLKIKKNIMAIIPLTENIPSSKALKPGDVVTGMSKTTVEIISTDAEGRMILADAVTYAKNNGAKKIMDFATLTGACVVALGDVASGVLGNDEEMIKAAIAAGEKSGERLWHLPLYKEYREYLKSDVADIKNASDLGKAGTSSGATFIKEFVKDTPWVHIDIAGTADLDRTVGHLPKGPTGVGIFTAVNYLS